MKRNDYITWDQYFMGIAILSSERSKDPSTRVGACIVNDDNKILSMGYNDNLKTKYPYVCHSELNAILNCPTSVKGARVYVTLFPCNECAKAIIQSGIKEVIYLSDKYHDSDGCKASRMMFDNCGVTYREYEMAGKDIVIKL